MLQNLIDRILNIKSTAIAVVSAALTILAAIGLADKDALSEGLAATNSIFEAVVVLLGAVSTFVSLFSKDNETVAAETEAKVRAELMK